MEIETQVRWYGSLLIFTLACSCNNMPFEVSEADKNPLSRNDDNQIFKSGAVQRFLVQYFDSLSEEKVIIFNGNKLANDMPFPVFDKGNELADSLLQVNFVEIMVEDARADNLLNDYQTTISYKYFNGQNVELHIYSRTSVVENAYNIWLHPPRDLAFKVLNLSAYPYVKFPLEIGSHWDYSMPIGDLWGHPDFGLWKENLYMFKHKYEIRTMEKVGVGDKLIDCYYVSAQTESEIGKTNSNFYYNPEYGFVKMGFFNLNGSEIRFTRILSNNK